MEPEGPNTRCQHGIINMTTVDVNHVTVRYVNCLVDLNMAINLPAKCKCTFRQADYCDILLVVNNQEPPQ